MSHSAIDLPTREIRKSHDIPTHVLDVDVCVVGAGIAGISAAVEASKLGRSVALVDSQPTLGGQLVNSIIGVIHGAFGNAPEYRQFTHGIFDDMLRDLKSAGALFFRRRHSLGIGYDEVQMGRWVEKIVREHGVHVITGAAIVDVRRDEDRIVTVQFATRYGSIEITAQGFVDASGDAALCWEAGLGCRLPERKIYGTQQMVVENVREDLQPDRAEISATAEAKAEQYGLVRHKAVPVFVPGRDIAVLNMTHIESPLDPVNAAKAQLEGREQADRVVTFLRTEFPQAFGEARVRAYGLPGVRQTRWVRAVHQLTVDEVRAGTRFPDAVARTAWPIELHDHPTGYVWEPFDADHVHYVPLRSMTPPEVHNVVVAGRCIDGDAAALSSVRVMGPCGAMGMGAAHALDMARDASVHEIDYSELASRLAANLDDV